MTNQSRVTKIYTRIPTTSCQDARTCETNITFKYDLWAPNTQVLLDNALHIIKEYNTNKHYIGL